ncbi:CinA family protein [Rubripirellula reticaptiva]|uniref:Nicotinamide-nucleotide amidohydrolase PncC n=1 Tax=Rubripirellula reticaptiva TaxID=2528013 RepID=A0A5C6ET17_9BACT|nr:nicotinamide-nucleotide amidohydrolase family protein [Rubripirellula reticaptiva]TWU51815.1 Nicotinamide-nucleotide amidohydrolase PncC [Rubripirellula reticaptiva]
MDDLSSLTESLRELATETVGRLAQAKCRIVFAESCTCGMVACELGKIPGVSEWLCGSAVTYRNDTKVRWIGVSAVDIDRHTAVSDPVARQMAAGVLDKTPEADLAVSITGHFGPDAPDGFDGLVFVGTCNRMDDGSVRCDARSFRMKSVGRQARQIEATQTVLRCLINALTLMRSTKD